MNHSTEQVTLWASFLLDVIREVEKFESEKSEFYALYSNYNLDNPFDTIPIQVYNDMCAWVENNLEEATIIQVGKNIGETAYKALVENNIIDKNSPVLEIMKGLQIAASSMIQDPEDRGWEILEHTPHLVLMRRTQTFNSKLQIGLLEGLASKAPNVQKIKVNYQNEVAKGALFDDYLIEWEMI